MRVLFVEDDAMNRRVVKDMLTIVGVTMEEAEDAETGLRMVDMDDYDAILMDLRMPGMDGLTAMRHIRARADRKAKTPIIVITADVGLDLRATCFAEGANQVLGKPVAMKTLFDALGDTLASNGDLMI